MRTIKRAILSFLLSIALKNEIFLVTEPKTKHEKYFRALWIESTNHQLLTRWFVTDVKRKDGRLYIKLFREY